jgi:hypothetical protein
MQLSSLVTLLLLGAGCATGSGSGPVLVVETYSVSDIVSDPAKAPQISTADLAQVVQHAVGFQSDSEQVQADGSGRLVAKASAASQELIRCVLADYRRFHSK